jgi:hypothetical protein
MNLVPAMPESLTAPHSGDVCVYSTAASAKQEHFVALPLTALGRSARREGHRRQMSSGEADEVHDAGDKEQSSYCAYE